MVEQRPESYNIFFPLKIQKFVITKKIFIIAQDLIKLKKFMKIKICTWKTCKSRFSEYIRQRLENDKIKFDLKNLEIETTTCMWKCETWPNIYINKEIFTNQNPLKTSELILKKYKNENK